MAMYRSMSAGQRGTFRKNVLSFYEVDWLSGWLKRLEGRNPRKYVPMYLNGPFQQLNQPSIHPTGYVDT